MAVPVQSRFRQNCRIVFRRLRFCVLFLFLGLVGALLYLNRVGLPGFIQNSLLQKLHARGVDLTFSRVRWRWDYGIVAENVHFGGAAPATGPTLTLKEVEVVPNYPALAKLQFQVDALILRQGRLTVPVGETNAPPRQLSLSNIQSKLRFRPDDLWELDHFRAAFAGGDIQLAGIITNASRVREWKLFQPREPAPPGTLQQRLRHWARALEQMHFARPPSLKLEVRGDARDLQSFTVQGRLRAPQADTPWGTFQQAAAGLRLAPAGSNELSHAEISVEAATARTPWATATNLQLTLRALAATANTNVARADLDLWAGGVDTEWGGATWARLKGHWAHSLTNPLPLSGEGTLELENLTTRWGGARQARLTGDFVSLTNALVTADPSWAWWTNLFPYALTWKCQLAGLQSPRLEADALSCAGEWRAPRLHAAHISARLYGGSLNAEAGLNVPTRELTFAGRSDFDAHGISGLLTEKSRVWLAQYSWEQPPRISAEGNLVLPAWTNRHPNWRLETKPTVQLRGQFHVENGAFRGVPVATADAHFLYSNEVWRLPDLVLIRPEGHLDIVHESNERNRDYFFHLHSTIDPGALRPLLEPRQQRALDLFGFTQPPVLDGDIRGRWHEPDRLGMTAHVVLTNFTLRGQSADRFEADLAYTNRLLELIEPRLQRAGGAEQMSVRRVDADFGAEKIYLTNGFSTADPLVVARAIGPHIGRDFEPYHFVQPPKVRVNGVIPMHGEHDADLHFDVDGAGFEWWKFKVPRIAGKVDWVEEQLRLSDLQVDFYRGAGAGSAQFDFQPGQSTGFRFKAKVDNADLHLLMNDLSSATNRLEGMLSGVLNITQAESKDPQSWQGRGHINLRDGLIWEIPVFGILSPVLDAIVPGMGSSRASEGSATFAITNSVIYSDDLEIRASMMRLQYRGMVDVRGHVDAHAEAELLRDTWVVGRFLSLALWPVSKLFEYRITGTLREPRSEPIYFVPKLVLFPFHPIRGFRDLMAPEPDFTQTNLPPARLP